MITANGFPATRRPVLCHKVLRRRVLQGAGLVALFGLGDLPFGAALAAASDKYPDRNDLIAIVTDETTRNPQTVMPPFGRNRILNEQEINAVVDFLQTL